MLIGVSGGADSTALLVAFSKISKKFSLKLVVAHVNYHLRGKDSGLDEFWVKKLCNKHGISFRQLDFPIKSYDSGVEELARNIRYDFFKEVSKDERCSFVATAHNANEQAETLIFRLARGTGVTGAIGISSFRKDGVIRPFLELTRNNIEAWLNDNEIGWQEDRTNSDTKYKRNLIRHRIIPLLEEINPQAISNLNAFSGHLIEIMSNNSDSWLDDHLLYCDQNEAVLKRSDCHPSTHNIHQLLVKLSIEPNRSLIKKLSSRWSDTGIELLLPNDFSCWFLKDRVVFCNKKSIKLQMSYKYVLVDGESCPIFPGFPSISLSYSASNVVKFEKSNRLAYISSEYFPLEVRTVTINDKITPFGRKKDHSCIELLKKKGITDWERKRYPVVCSNDVPIWLPDVAFSEMARSSTFDELYCLKYE